MAAMAQTEVPKALGAEHASLDGEPDIEDDPWPQDEFDGDLLALVVVVSLASLVLFHGRADDDSVLVAERW